MVFILIPFNLAWVGTGRRKRDRERERERERPRGKNPPKPCKTIPEDLLINTHWSNHLSPPPWKVKRSLRGPSLLWLNCLPLHQTVVTWQVSTHSSSHSHSYSSSLRRPPTPTHTHTHTHQSASTYAIPRCWLIKSATSSANKSIELWLIQYHPIVVRIYCYISKTVVMQSMINVWSIFNHCHINSYHNFDWNSQR